MDRTDLFKASIKAIKTKNKALGVKEPVKDNLRSKRKRTEFEIKAKDVVNSITKLRDFLLEHRKDYIDAMSLSQLSSQVCTMTDEERDQIDNDAEMYMRTCAMAIKTLKAEVPASQHHSDQVTRHKDTVLDMLGEYLKVVCKLYSEQRAIRVKRAVDRKRISRLQPEHRKSPHVSTGVERQAELRSDHTSEINIKRMTDPELEAEVHDAVKDDKLTAEEVQMFELENKKLFKDMNSLVDEVRQIEGKVVEISKLQEIFSEKVLQQATQIDRIYETTVFTTENVKEGNEQIREAIKNNASFRVWILFFLVMCSFSLLFLDWYS